MPAKHPVNRLQESLANMKLPNPTYTCNGSGTNFTCTVTANGIKAVAQSTSKKNARKAAAQQALLLLSNTMKPKDGKTKKNIAKKTPIVLLKEFIDSKGLPAPLNKYEGSGNKFVCTITVKDTKVVVEATSKRGAKNEAAKLALETLRKNTTMTLVEKTPVALLQDYLCAKHLGSPEYTFDETSETECICKVKVNGVTSTSRSMCKKTAKNDAARKALDILGKKANKKKARKKATKTPVVLLQEYAEAKSLPYPIYKYKGSGNEFICTLTASDTTVTIKSASKKSARTKAATLVLEILSQNPSSKKKKKAKATAAASTATAITNKTSFVNYIGELNTYAMKYKLKLPTYTFLHSTLSGQYVFHCEFLQHQCEGLGVNKKDAKQESARAMLKIWLAGKTPVTLLKEYTEANDHLYPQYAYEESGSNFTCTVIVNGIAGVGCCKLKKSAKQKAAKQLIDILIKSTDLQKVEKKKTTKQAVLIPENANQENLSQADAETVAQVKTSLEMMKLQLRLLELGFEHEITDFPARGDNFVVSLTVNGTDFTVYGKGKTKDHAVIDAIQTTLLFKKKGCQFVKVSELFSNMAQVSC